MGERMKKRALVPLLVAVAMMAGVGCESGCQPSGSDTPSTATEASAVAPASPTPSVNEQQAISQVTVIGDAWMKLLDAGKYGDAWEQFDDDFKKSSPKDDWCKQVNAIRTALGPVVSRSIDHGKFKQKIDDRAKDFGQFVTVDYDTVFERQPNGIEQFTAMRAKDGTWHPRGYYLTVKSPTPTARATK